MYSCPICKEHLSEEVFILSTCGHQFHLACIDCWQHVKLFLCQFDIVCGIN